MLKIILIMILILCNIAYCVDDAETYSDEKPKIFLYKEGNFLPGKKYVTLKSYSIANELRSYGHDYDDQYSLHQSDDEDITLFVRDIYRKENFDASDIMKAINVPVRLAFFQSNKWSLPRVPSEYDGDIIEVNPLSWRHLDVFLHSAQQLPYGESTFPPNAKLDALYQIMGQKKQEKIGSSYISRWLFTRNQKNYRVYFVYNHDKELENMPKLDFSIF